MDPKFRNSRVFVLALAFGFGLAVAGVRSNPAMLTSRSRAARVTLQEKRRRTQCSKIARGQVKINPTVVEHRRGIHPW